MLVYDGGLRPSGYPSDGRLQSRHTVQILSSGVFSANTMPPFFVHLRFQETIQIHFFYNLLSKYSLLLS